VYNRIQAAKGHTRANGSPPTSFHPIQPAKLDSFHNTPLQQSPLQQPRLSPQQQLKLDSPVITVGQPPPYQLGGMPFTFPDRGPSGEVQTALMAAVEGNDIAEVTSILTTFPSLVNCESEVRTVCLSGVQDYQDGQSPLFGATSPEMLQLLIERSKLRLVLFFFNSCDLGADVNHRSKVSSFSLFSLRNRAIGRRHPHVLACGARPGLHAV